MSAIGFVGIIVFVLILFPFYGYIVSKFLGAGWVSGIRAAVHRSQYSQCPKCRSKQKVE